MKIISVKTVTGSYGKYYNVDESPVTIVKRSKRGRPRKNEISEGNFFTISPILDKWVKKSYGVL